MPTPRGSWTAEKAEIVEKMSESGEKTKKIAEIVKMSVRSVQQYINSHISEVKGDRWKPFEPRKKRQVPNKVARREAIGAILDLDCTLTQLQIVDRLPQELKCSKRVVSAAIKDLGYTRKRLRKIPIERNTPTNIHNRKIYAASINRKSDSKLFFLDETGFNLHTGPRFGYALRGLTPTMEQPGNRGENVSLMACIGLHGVKHWEMVDNAYNGERMIEFLDTLCSLLPSGAILIMDNASFHRREDVKRKLEREGVISKYLPPYSPQLNPIEEFFGALKGNQEKIRPRPKTRVALKASIEATMNQLRNRDMVTYYEHMRDFVQIALNNQPFV